METTAIYTQTTHEFDCPRKEAVRQRIWQFLGEYIGPREEHRRTLVDGRYVKKTTVREPETVLLLPGGAPFEIDVARRHGFPFAAILLVEKNPAVMANLMRRFTASERQELRRVAAPLSKAVKVFVDQGIRIGGGHLDFCGHVDGAGPGSVIAELECVAYSGIIPDRVPLCGCAYLAVTVSVGHERRFDLTARQRLIQEAVSGVSRRRRKSANGEWETIIEESLVRAVQEPYLALSDRDCARVLMLKRALAVGPLKDRVGVSEAGTYVNSRTHFRLLWVIFDIVRA